MALLTLTKDFCGIELDNKNEQNIDEAPGFTLVKTRTPRVVTRVVDGTVLMQSIQDNQSMSILYELDNNDWDWYSGGIESICKRSLRKIEDVSKLPAEPDQDDQDNQDDQDIKKFSFAKKRCIILDAIWTAGLLNMVDEFDTLLYSNILSDSDRLNILTHGLADGFNRDICNYVKENYESMLKQYYSDENGAIQAFEDDMNIKERLSRIILLRNKHKYASFRKVTLLKIDMQIDTMLKIIDWDTEQKYVTKNEDELKLDQLSNVILHSDCYANASFPRNAVINIACAIAYLCKLDYLDMDQPD